MRTTLTLSILALIFFSGCDSNTKSNITEVKSPAGLNSSLPYLYTDNTGSVFMSWVEETGKQAQLKYASFDGDSWSSPAVIASDSTWFLNWADFPSIIAENGKPMAAHWLNKVPGGTYAYHINMATFDNSWEKTFTPHKDNTPTEHGFVSMTPATDSTFLALWLDGRKTTDRETHEYLDLSKAMTLRSALVHTKSGVKQTFLIDDSVCDCCNTSIVKTDKGFVAAYRNRAEGEIRDIYISTFADDNWSEPKAIYSDNWEIAACPVNGPSIDAHDKFVAVAWFTGANKKAAVKLAISQDYGETFGSPITLDNNAPLGRIDLNMTENKIWVSWLSPSVDAAELKIRSFTFEGVKNSESTLSDLSNSRSTGFPQISIAENGLLISYTDLSNDKPQVKTFVLK